MEQLDRSDQRRLLAIARHAIELAVRHNGSGDEDATPVSGALIEPAAAFVTLHEGGDLRGCIGLMRFDVPLWENVRDAAVSAALNDPRFVPVAPSETGALELEISVLEPPVELSDPAGFVAGRHGIIVERGMRHGLLLPQVATEMGWDEAQMLEAVCRKAGLPPGSWREPSTRLYVFESYCFGEADAKTAATEPG